MYQRVRIRNRTPLLADHAGRSRPYRTPWAAPTAAERGGPTPVRGEDPRTVSGVNMEASGTGVPAGAAGGIGADDRAPDVSVVVLGYNGLRYCEACLDALRAQVAETPPFEVVFFDNASTDGTPDRVAAAHPWVRLVRNPTNLGFAAGNVAALGEVRG